MKKILMFLTSLSVIFNPLLLTSCNIFGKKTIFVTEKLSVSNDTIDLDCNKPFNKESMIEANDGEFVNKTWPVSIQKLLRYQTEESELTEKIILHCSRENLIKADQEAVEDFNEFTNPNAYHSYEEVNSAVYKATNAQLNFDEIIKNYVVDIDETRQTQFKAIILRLYNVLAKLVGKDSAAYLIFDLKVQKNLGSNSTLAVSIGFPDLTGNGGVSKSCIIYSQQSLNVTKEMLLANHLQNMFWTTDSFFHPFIHEFGHIIDYYLSMTPENRLQLKQGLTFSINKAACQEESSYRITNNDIQKYHSNSRTIDNPYSIGADALKKYLFSNVRNHNFPKTSSFLYENGNIHSIRNIQDMLAYIVVRSDYAITINPELFAEAFALWLVTSENKRARNWQILNRFFTTFLKKRIDCPNCVVE